MTASLVPTTPTVARQVGNALALAPDLAATSLVAVGTVSASSLAECQVSRRQSEFEQFFLLHYDQVVRSLVAILGDEQVAHDCAQEAFIKAAGRWRKLRRYDNPLAWIRRVAINQGRDIYRSESRRRDREERVGLAHDDGAGDRSGAVDSAMHVTQLLQRLPAMQRAAAALYYVDDLAVADIAYQLDVSVGTVKYHLNQARNALRPILEQGDGHDGS